MQNQRTLDVLHTSIYGDPNLEAYEEDSLEHHGVLGMSWGRRHGPPYPLDGVDKRVARAEAKRKREKERRLKKLQKAAKKARKLKKREEKEAADIQKKKQKLVKKGDMDAIKKNAKLFTNEELQYIVERDEAKRAILGKKERDEQAAFDKFNQKMGQVADVALKLGTVIGTVKQGADMVSSFKSAKLKDLEIEDKRRASIQKEFEMRFGKDDHSPEAQRFIDRALAGEDYTAPKETKGEKAQRKMEEDQMKRQADAYFEDAKAYDKAVKDASKQAKKDAKAQKKADKTKAKIQKTLDSIKYLEDGTEDWSSASNSGGWSISKAKDSDAAKAGRTWMVNGQGFDVPAWYSGGVSPSTAQRESIASGKSFLNSKYKLAERGKYSGKQSFEQAPSSVITDRSHAEAWGGNKGTWEQSKQHETAWSGNKSSWSYPTQTKPHESAWRGKTKDFAKEKEDTRRKMLSEEKTAAYQKAIGDMMREATEIQNKTYRETVAALNREKAEKHRVGYNVSSGKGYGKGGVIGVSQKKLDSLRGIQEYSRKWNFDFNAGKHPEGPHPWKNLPSKDRALVNRYVYWGTAGRPTKFSSGPKTTAKGKYHRESIEAAAKAAAEKAGKDFMDEYFKKLLMRNPERGDTMSNEMTIALFHSEWDFQNEQDDYLAHYGILGMHWGIRRYQPYGEGGYDPDHEGKNIGLAARLAGHTGSYSDAIKRGSSFGNRAKSAAKSFGKRAGRAANEGLERLNYANDRLGEGLKRAGGKLRDAGKNTRRALANYAASRDPQREDLQRILDEGYDESIRRLGDRAKGLKRTTVAELYEGHSNKELARDVITTFSNSTKKKVADLKQTSFDDVKSALGSGASRFQSALQKTARNAAMTSALFGGALDPKNEGFTKVQAKSDVASGLSGKSSSLYSGWYEHQSSMNPGQRLTEIMNGGRSQGIHGDAMDLAGRLASNKYGALSKTGRDMFKNKHNTRAMINLQESGPDRSTFKTYDPRAAIRTQMLTDLGSGKNLGKNRGPLSRQSSYDSARQRDLIRSAGGSKSNGLYEIGDRIDPISKETIHKAPKAFKNNRENINPNNHYTYGGDLSYDLNNGLRQARSILLQDMSVKDPYRKAFNARDLERAQSTVKSMFADLERAESVRTMKGGAYVDPYLARSLGIIK